MKKLAVIFVIGMILLMTLGIVFANGIEESIEEDLKAKGKKVDNITEKDFSDLPPQIDIKNIEFGTNLAIYEVDVGEEKPVFVITTSDEMLQKSLRIPTYTRLFLNFGFNGEMDESGFLKTSTGVEGNLEKGYVMMREGSITGISTNLDIINSNDLGWIEIIIYKNGEPIGFRNTLNAFSSGMKKDYDIQSKDTVMFESGDIISVYIKAQEEIVWKDVITMIEVTIEN